MMGWWIDIFYSGIYVISAKSRRVDDDRLVDECI
jgi:hypothetical protein